MIERDHPKVSVRRQCDLLELPRSTAYYRPAGESPENLELMRQIDEIYTKCPFYGTRQMTRALKRAGAAVNRKRISRLMKLMGLEAQCPKPNLSKPAPGHKVYPYLMKNRVVDGPGQAWCVDITYIRLEGGFVYLVAILDWHSRMVLGWALSNSMDVAFCLQALEQAVSKYGPPGLMNTDQGSQFTSEPWIGKLEGLGIEISMDGKGRALDNVFVERLWRTVKYEEVYRREYVDVADARHHLAAYFEFYNHNRPHSALAGRTPAEAHGLANTLAA
jgi:putative transposase